LAAQSAIRDQTRGMTHDDQIAIIRIELEGIEPLIWRRVAVRTVMNLNELHGVIQAVMGWLNCHLWAFEADDRRFSMRLPVEPEWNEQYENSERTALGMLLQAGLRRMEYVYDMGDYWQHRVDTVEKGFWFKPHVARCGLVRSLSHGGSGVDVTPPPMPKEQMQPTQASVPLVAREFGRPAS
jgi:hypothetical protein